MRLTSCTKAAFQFPDKKQWNKTVAMGQSARMIANCFKAFYIKCQFGKRYFAAIKERLNCCNNKAAYIHIPARK